MATTRSEAKAEALEKMVLTMQENMESMRKAIWDLADLKVLVEQMVKGKSRSEGDRPGDNVKQLVDGNHESPYYQNISDGRESVEEETKLAIRRVELPGFDGADPLRWLGKAERYFEIHGTAPDHRLKIAYICMEGSTVHWYRWMRMKMPNMSWERFAEELIKRYSGRTATNLFELLASLKQEQQPVEIYIEQFEVLLARIGDLPEEQCLGYFLGGLREELRWRVRSHEPRSVFRAIELARSVEEELYEHLMGYQSVCTAMASPRVVDRRNGFSNGPTNRGQQMEKDPTRYSPTTHNISRNEVVGEGLNRRAHPFLRQPAIGGGCKGANQKYRERKIYSHQEFLNLMEKGLCVRSEGPDHPLHKCACKSMWVTVLAEDEEKEEAVEAEEQPETHAPDYGS